MSTPDLNLVPPETVSPTLVAESEIPDVRTSPPQSPPTLPSPSPPLPHRAAPPLQQEPSAILSPSAPPGQGFPIRPIPKRPLFSADPSVTASIQSGHPHIPGFSGNHHRQLGPNQMETMMQFMRSRYLQSRQFPRPGSGPHFLQPRVAPPPASIPDTSRDQHRRRKDAPLVLVRGRKARITEGASLYSLSRSWLRNGGAYERIQIQRRNTMNPLPNPFSMDMMEASVPKNPAEELRDEDKEDEEAVKHFSEKDLLKRHINRAKKIRARSKAERLRKIGKYKERLALVLSQNQEPK